MGPRLGIWLVALAFALLPTPVRAEEGPRPEAPNRQDELWSHVKNVRAGPVTFDLGGQVRFRYENDDGFTIKGYEPGGHDELLRERVRLDLSAMFWKRPRLVLAVPERAPLPHLAVVVIVGGLYTLGASQFGERRHCRPRLACLRGGRMEPTKGSVS